MNQNMPPMGPGGPQMSPNSNQTSPAAIIALVCTFLSMCTSLFCCAGLVPGGLAVILGIFSIVQYRNGNANQASAIMGGISVVLSGLAIMLYSAMMVFGVGAGMLGEMSKDTGFDMPALEQYQQESQQPTY